MKHLVILLSFLFYFFPACTHHPITASSKGQQDEKVNKFFETFFESRVQRYPTWQTYLGRKTSYGLLDNETEAFAQAEHELTLQDLARLKSFNFHGLSPEVQTSYRILKYQLEMEIAGHKWRYHAFPLNQMFGYQSETPSFLINMHQIESVSDAHDYISRLKEIKRVFAERLDFVKKQASLGIMPPQFVFSKVIADSRNIITGKPFGAIQKNSPLYEDFKAKLLKLNLPPPTRQELLLEAESALKKFVLPAYQDLISYLKILDGQTVGNHGAWSLPDGEDYYNFCLQSSTTTDMTAAEIHAIGLAEVKRIQQEMKSIMQQVGFKGSLQDFFTHMRSNKYRFPDTAAGRAAYLAEVDEVITSIKTELPRLFKTFPKAQLLIKPVESFREKSAGTAFYSGPSLEGNRPGIYYVNLYKMADNPKYKLEALAYHEAIPGHHMQIAIASEMEDLPMFRRSGGFTAYSEGWGLYAEQLPKEIGLYQDPYSDFGRLSMEIWRATRLVVDTGIHAKKWTREEAINFMTKNTPSAKLETIKEIERYFVMPGQATAYKVGMMKILDLRKQAQDAMGEKFDIRDYHDIVLRDGAIPLEILADKVKLWIKGK